MIKLEETADEYLLFVPISQKDRAKRIAGREWDRKRLCWVYPKTRLVYNALITEFRNELEPNNHVRRRKLRDKTRDKQVGHKIDWLRKENERLRAKLKDMQDTLNTVVNDKKLAEEHVSALQVQVASREKKITAVTERLRKVESEREEVEEAARKAKAKEVNLRAKNKELRAEIKKIESKEVAPKKPIGPLLLDIAKEIAQGEPRFLSLIDRFGLDPSLAVQLGMELERELRSLLNPAEGSLKSDELIRYARDAGILSRIGKCLADTIRIYRNILAHEPDTRTDVLEGTVVPLFAASLLWRQLPA
jgi:myosin heavy subunit